MHSLIIEAIKPNCSLLSPIKLRDQHTMTKAIKFNLLLDKYPVRDLEDLKTHFNLDDLLVAYHGQVLHRWLEVRGLITELSLLNEIKSNDELLNASALCKLFHKTLSREAIQQAVYPFEFRQQQQHRLERLASQQFKRNEVIKSYHGGYTKLCGEMLEECINYPFLKAAVNTLWADYADLFRVDFNRFFDEFIEKSPLTLLTMLGEDNYRQSGLFTEERKESLFLLKLNKTPEKLSPILSLLSALFGTLTTPSCLQYYSGETDNYWKDLQPKGTKCLILKMEPGNFIRNSGKNGEDLNADAINKQFLILDGIDYKSNNVKHDLVYMVI